MRRMHPLEEHLRAVTRRAFFKRSGFCFGAIALGALLSEETWGQTPVAHAPGSPTNPLAPRRPHFAARAKHVIYLHMVGAPSQLDLYDHKPALAKYDGQPCPEEFIKGKRFAFLRGHPNIAASRFAFQRHGQSGAEASELLTHLA